MAALTEALQHQAEQNPTASYYNLVLLRYQVRLSRDRARAGHINYANTESALRPLLATRGTAYGPAWTRLGLGGQRLHSPCSWMWQCRPDTSIFSFLSSPALDPSQCPCK